MTTEVDTSTLHFTDEDIATAGLRHEGWYLFDLKSKRTDHVEGGISQRTGRAYDAFDVVKAFCVARQHAKYDDNGNFVESSDLPGGFPMTINLDGSSPGLARLKGLYKAIRGSNLTGNGDVESTAEELLGGQFWARIYHRKGSDDVLREEMDTFRFRSRDYGPPSTIPVRSNG